VGVASSSDGTKLVALVGGGQLYSSTDSGVTWIACESARNWYSVASSSDGSKLVAVVPSGQIHTISVNDATLAPPYIRVAAGFLYIQDAGTWKKTALSDLSGIPEISD
jgi:hypothetical protein